MEPWSRAPGSLLLFSDAILATKDSDSFVATQRILFVSGHLACFVSEHLACFVARCSAHFVASLLACFVASLMITLLSRCFDAVLSGDAVLAVLFYIV